MYDESCQLDCLGHWADEPVNQINLAYKYQLGWEVLYLNRKKP